MAAGSRFATNERLQEMLKKEIKVGKSSAVIKVILSNPNLQEIDEETWRNLSKNENDVIRVLAARSRVATNERLQKMLKHEPEVEQSLFIITFIIKTILSNPNLQEIDEETWRNLVKTESSLIRLFAARSRVATNERLQEMLKQQIKVSQSLPIIEAILSNSNLKEIDEEAWKSLSECIDWKIRELAAGSRFATRKRLVKMVEHEMKNPDSEVMEAIMSNKNFQS